MRFGGGAPPDLPLVFLGAVEPRCRAALTFLPSAYGAAREHEAPSSFHTPDFGPSMPPLHSVPPGLRGTARSPS